MFGQRSIRQCRIGYIFCYCSFTLHYAQIPLTVEQQAARQQKLNHQKSADRWIDNWFVKPLNERALLKIYFSMCKLSFSKFQ